MRIEKEILGYNYKSKRTLKEYKTIKGSYKHPLRYLYCMIYCKLKEKERNTGNKNSRLPIEPVGHFEKVTVNDISFIETGPS